MRYSQDWIPYYQALERMHPDRRAEDNRDEAKGWVRRGPSFDTTADAYAWLAANPERESERSDG